MTVSSTNTKNSYSGNGSTTAFAYTFKVFDEDDLTVILRTDATGTETVQAITTNYTVSGVGDAGGGNVTFVTAPASGVTVVIRRAAALTQTTDYTPNDPFPASEHENALDKLTFFAQQQQEELDRSIKLSRTNTMTSTEFTVGSSDRANKILGFDGTGELSVTQELGVFRGNWSSGTSFAVRDLIKDTTNNNIYICQVAHTSSGSLPISTNTDSSKWELIVDAATATSSATAAAASEAAAATSETNAATSETNAATSATNAAASEASVAADASAAAASATAASASETAAAASETAAAASETAAAASETAAASSASSASTSASTATTKAAEAATSATNAATSETNAASSASAAATSAANASSSETNAATSASAASTSASNAATSETNAATSAANAATSETNAATSETNAAASATSASSSASTATTKAAEAATSASNAATSETNAATSETNAATSETNAATSATSASTAQTAAETAQTAAEAAKTAAELAADNFDDTYLGAKSSDPTVDNDGDALTAGDLYFNTTSDQLKYYTGSAWVAIAPGIANVSEDSSPQLGGDLQSNGNDIVFADNDKAIFGASSDLQLYHDGANSYIQDTGTGDLIITSGVHRVRTDQFQLNNAANNAALITAANGGAAKLFYNGTNKVETTSSGVSVTGDVLPEANATRSLGSNSLRYSNLYAESARARYFYNPDDTNTYIEFPENDSIKFFTNGGQKAVIQSDGKFRLNATANQVTGYELFTCNGSAGFKSDQTNVVGMWQTSSSGHFIQFFGGSGAAGCGNIGFINNNNLMISNDADNSGLQFGSGSITPAYDGAGQNNSVDLGSTSTRFKDGYFSNGITARYHYNLDDPDTYIDFATGNLIRFFNGGSEKGRFTTSGFAVGKTSSGDVSAAGAELSTTGYGMFSRSDNIAIYANRGNTGSLVWFGRAGANKGDISVSSTGTTYNTTSDIRLKQDIEPLVATDKLMAMNPVSYSWKADPDGQRSMGFIAQEMQEVMPEAVSTGDDEDAMMSMDYGRITPILVSALQDAHRKIEQLESRIAAMEIGNE